jgi:hypothetical protein
LKYFAEKFIHAAGALSWLKEQTVKRGLKPPPVFDAQLRLGGERDVSMGVLVDLPRREVRIRKWGGNTIALPLSRKNVEWIEERLKMAPGWSSPRRGLGVAGGTTQLRFTWR